MPETGEDGNIILMNLNLALFQKVNKLVGRNRYLDLFGRAGAEFVIIAMIGWYVASVFITELGDRKAILLRLVVLLCAWLIGWGIDVVIGAIVREPRPHVTHPESRLLFQPMMSWKSFPSDHAMSAWLIFFVSLMFSLRGAEGLGIMALWVSWGRVYAGLHYPFDIVGGLTVAALITLLSYNVLVVFF